MKTKTLKRSFLFISFMIFFMSVSTGSFSVAQAATYYVDFAGGNDTDSGLSAQAPWQHCPGDANATKGPRATDLRPGDTIVFKGGIAYLGTVDIKWNGTQKAPIIYDGNSAGTFGTGRAIIDGEGDRLGINARQYGIYSSFVQEKNVKKGPSYIVIDNFEIRNLRYIYEDRPANQPVGIYIMQGIGTDMEIKNCYLYEIKKKALAVNTYRQSILSAADLITGTSLSDSTFSDVNKDLSQYTGGPGKQTIYKILVGWSRTDYDRAWGYIGGSANSANCIKIYKDIDLTKPGWNFFSARYNPLGKKSYFYWVYDMNKGSHMESGGSGITVSGYSNLSIHDNVVRDARMGIICSASNGRSADNVKIYNNDVTRASWGINVTSGCYPEEDITNLKIYNNTIHDFLEYVEYDWGYHRDGIFLYNAGRGKASVIRGVKIFNNFFYGNIGGATALLYMTGNVSQVQIYNNLFASSAGPGGQIRTIGDRKAITVHDIQIYNNVFAKIPGEEKYCMESEGTPRITLRNNIIYLFEQWGTCFSLDARSVDGFSSDYNLLHSAHPFNKDLGYRGTMYSLENWQKKDLPFPHDQHSIIRRDPLFKKFPKFAGKVLHDGTTTRIYLVLNKNPLYNHTFKIGDRVEYNYDHVIRTVTASGNGSYVDIAPPLSKNSMAGETILNWKDASDFVYDLHLKDSSPLINKGINLSAEIGDLDKDGVSRPQNGAWDIGAYEHVSTGDASK